MDIQGYQYAGLVIAMIVAFFAIRLAIKNPSFQVTEKPYHYAWPI
jgi:hypothetical protein